MASKQWAEVTLTFKPRGIVGKITCDTYIEVVDAVEETYRNINAGQAVVFDEGVYIPRAGDFIMLSDITEHSEESA